MYDFFYIVIELLHLGRVRNMYYAIIDYTYLDSGNRITKIYILEYTYNDYHTDKTIGGLM